MPGSGIQARRGGSRRNHARPALTHGGCARSGLCLLTTCNFRNSRGGGRDIGTPIAQRIEQMTELRGCRIDQDRQPADILHRAGVGGRRLHERHPQRKRVQDIGETDCSLGRRMQSLGLRTRLDSLAGISVSRWRLQMTIDSCLPRRHNSLHTTTFQRTPRNSHMPGDPSCQYRLTTPISLKTRPPGRSPRCGRPTSSARSIVRDAYPLRF